VRVRLAAIGVGFVLIAGCTRVRSTCPVSSGGASAIDTAFVPHRVLYEGKLVELHDVAFEGNAHVTSDLLRAQLQSASSATLYDDELERDALMLQAFYYDHGYLEIQVAPVETSVDALGRLKMLWRVSEGEQYFVAQLDVYEKLTTGTVAPPMGGWTVPSGIVHQPFSRRDLVATLDSLNTLYRDAGFAFVDATPISELDKKLHLVSLEVPIVRGPLVHVAKIRVEGNKVIGEAMIRDALLIHEGDVYSDTKIALSKKRLKETEWFQRVDVSSDRVNGQDVIWLTFEVEESWRVAPMLTAMASAD
jgi:outer membrane protein insertion porin family